MNLRVLDHLTLKKLEEFSKNKNCCVNEEGYFSHQTVSRVYKCTCLGKEVLMCQSCSQECHHNHQLTLDEKEYTNFICGCALENHAFKRVLDKPSRKTFHDEQDCQLMKLIKYSNTKSYYKNIYHENDYLCHVCYDSIRESENDYVIHELENQQFPEELIKCSCYSQNDDHSTKGEFRSIFFYLNNESKLFNSDQISFAIMNAPELQNLVVDKINKRTNEISDKINKDEYRKIQVQEKDAYLNRLLQFVCIYSKNKTSKSHAIITNYCFKDTINFDFLDLLFTTKEIPNDYFLRLKYYYMIIFRKFQLIPLSGSKCASYLANDINTNFVHRFFLHKSIDELCNELGVTQAQFLKLIDKMSNSVKEYFYLLNSSKIGGKQEGRFLNFLEEYLNYIKWVLKFRIGVVNLQNIMNYMNMLRENLMNREKFTVHLLKKIETIFYAISIKINDLAIHDRLSKNPLVNHELKFVFEDSDHSFSILKNLFLICSTNLEHYFDKNDKENENFITINKSEFFELFINENDFYIESLSNCLKSKTFKFLEQPYHLEQKKFKIADSLNDISLSKLKETFNSLNNLQLDYLKKSMSHVDFIENLNKKLFDTQEVVKSVYSQISSSHTEKIIINQLAIFQLGYVDVLFSLIKFIKTSHFSRFNLIPRFKIELLYDKIIDIIEFMIKNNTFIISLFFNTKIFSIFSKDAKKYRMLTNRCYNFFLNMLKCLNHNEYRLNLNQFLKYFFPLHSQFKDNFDTKFFKSMSSIRFFLIILELNDLKTYDLVQNHIGILLSQIIKNQNFSRIMTVYHELTENEKTIGLKLIKRICATINLLSSEYFMIVAEHLFLKKGSYNNNSKFFEKMLSLEELEPNYRSIFTLTYMNYHFIYPQPAEERVFITSNNLTPYNSEESAANKNGENEKVEFIIKLMKKFPVFQKRFHKLFSSELDSYFRFFIDNICLITENLIYFLIYNNNLDIVPTHQKATIFRISDLFLKCYISFLTSISSIYNEKKKSDISIIIKKYLPIEDKEISFFLNNSIQKLENNINTFNDPKFLHFNTDKVLEVINTYFNDIKYKIDKKSESSEFDKKHQYYKSLSTIVEDYLKNKKNFLNSSEKNLFILHKIFLNKDEIQIKNLKTSIIVSLVSKFKLVGPVDTDDLANSPKYDESNKVILESICKLFKADPSFWQNFFSSNKEFIMKMLEDIIRNQITYLTRPVLVEYNRLGCKFNNPCYIHLIYLLEFLRLLAENHNSFFQTLVIHFPLSESEKLKKFIKTIITIWISMDKSMNNIYQKESFLAYFIPKTGYFNKLFKSISELLIELFQGTHDFNFNVIDFSRGKFKTFFEIENQNFNVVQISDEFIFKLNLYMKFLNTYIEENRNKNKRLLLEKTNPKQMLNFLFLCMKKVYKKFICSDSQKKEKYFRIPKNGYLKLLEIYKTSENFSSDDLFQLSVNISIFFNLASLIDSDKADKYRKILEDMHNLLEEKDQNKNDEDLMEKVEIFKFFHEVIKTIEISYQNHDQEKFFSIKGYFENYFDEKVYLNLQKEIQNSKYHRKNIKKVIFLAHPFTLYLNESDIEKFYNRSPQGNFNEKLDYLLSRVRNYLEIVRLRRLCWKKHKIFFYLYLLDYQIVEYISCFLAIITNVLLLISLTDNVLESPIDYWIMYVATLHNIILFVLISIFWSFEYYKNWVRSLEKSHQKINYFSVFSLNIRSEILILEWNLIIGIIASISVANRFLFSMQLFIIWTLYDTMKNVIKAVKNRSKQFLATGSLILIFVLFYSSISFYYFRSKYYSQELNENLCDSFYHCFLRILNYGLRSGGIGDFTNIISYTDQIYWSHFIFNWIFYFTVILLMLNIINGIIVDTFQELRENSNERNFSKNHICYICSLQRSKFEISGLDFEDHTNKDHNTINYFHYLMKINILDQYDFNSIEYYVYHSINNGRKDFFPIKKCISLKEETII